MAVPAVWRLVDGIVVLSEVALRKLVVMAVPFTVTLEPVEMPPETKLDPVTVTVVPVEPCKTVFGLMEMTVGIGLVTAKESVFVELPPPGAGFVTVTGTVWAVLRSDAVRVTWIWVLLSQFTAAPDRVSEPQMTVAPGTIPVPLMVTVGGVLFTTTEGMSSDRSVGFGLFTMKVMVLADCVPCWTFRAPTRCVPETARLAGGMVAVREP